MPFVRLVRIKKYASAFLKASPLSILRQLILANFGFRVKEPINMKTTKIPSMALAILIGLIPASVMAKLKPQTIAKDAEKAEKEVQKDLSSGIISQSDADAYNDRLNHVISVMTKENSGNSERSAMREEVFKIVAELNAKEAGGH